MSRVDEAREYLGQLSRLHRGGAAPPQQSRLTNFFDGFRASSFGASPFNGGSRRRGGYQGGQVSRLTEDWQPGGIGPNRAFSQDGRLLRNRAWDLYDNNPFATSAIDAYISNVIECGIFPERDDPEWEHGWRRWGGLTAHATRECDITGDSTIYELQALWLTEIICGGGCLLHFVDMPRRSQRVPMALELIGEERFADHLQSSGLNPKTANPVSNGIEYDRATGKSIAYHVYVGHPRDDNYDPLRTMRLPREACEYAFIKGRIGARRGTSLLKAAVMWLWAMGYYADNELHASQLKSSWAYAILTDAADQGVGSLASDGAQRLTDVNGNPVDWHEPGMVWRGSSTDKIQGIGPNVPGSDSLAWIQMIQRSIAIGVKLSYEEVFRDYSKGSFSSVRMARGQDKKRYKPLQAFTIAHFGNPTVRRFDLAAVGAGLSGLPSAEAFLSQADDLWDRQTWQTPGWESPNPKDDATADDIRLKNRTITRQRVIGRDGGSWKKEFAQMELEERELESRGIVPDASYSVADDAADPPTNSSNSMEGDQ